ncbi:MAG: hypothetical protein DIU62_004880 [Pseudomonadota bacterium]|jgi:hypothetical protein|nr:MAG: hypothetical protein DIU62_07370 [Pseudomonadota bacterium]
MKTTTAARKKVSACLAALLLAGAAFAATPAPEDAGLGGDTPQLEELGEVVVSGERPARKVAELIPWLRRLLGEYTVEGYVDVAGQGEPEDRRPASGSGICVGFGVAPGVQCQFTVTWDPPRPGRMLLMPASASAMKPVMILYGVEPDELGIRYLQVDSRGLAEGATGVVVGDDGSFKAACVDMPDGCERITRITALPESKYIEMQVDTVVNGDLEVRYRFQLTRVREPQAEDGGAKLDFLDLDEPAEAEESPAGGGAAEADE